VAYTMISSCILCGESQINSGIQEAHVSLCPSCIEDGGENSDKYKEAEKAVKDQVGSFFRDIDE